jgi:putative ABC transport system substrate-binding protein
VVALFLVLTGLPSAGCGRAEPAKPHTIGVVQYDRILSPVFDGFKAKMVALGHVEGKNVTYVYHGLLKPDPQVIEREVEALKNQRVDLLLTLGTQPTLAAKKATAGTAISVVFAPVLNPVGSGVVPDVAHPGGNVTGVRNGDTLPKSLEWLHRIVPSATKIYAIYHPKDSVSQTAIRSLPTVATAIGVDLALVEAQSPEEALAVIATLSNRAALFFVPTPSLEPIGRLVEAAARHGIAAAANVDRAREAGVLVTYAVDWFAVGQQAARLVDQILKGAKPADLPVETAEHFLHINLKAATAIGLTIPDDILRQADLVIR